MINGKTGTILIITQTYPYDYAIEKTFIEPELEYLIKYFKDVIIFPFDKKGNIYKYPGFIKIDTSLAEFKDKNKNIFNIIKSIFSIDFLKEIIKYPMIILKPFKIREVIAFLWAAKVIKKYFKNYLSKNNIDIKKLICYSFWFDHTTLGFCLLKDHFFKQIKIISRAHGNDLFESRRGGYIPFRIKTLKIIDRLYLACENSKNYMSNKFPEFKDKFYVSQIGVRDPCCISKSSTDGTIRIVSCSGINAFKRINLIMDGLNKLAELINCKIEWHHFGDGPDRFSIEEKAKNLSNNIKVFFHGHIPIEDILNYYKNNPVDIFITTSYTEGGSPISIKEALSYGIPVIGTAVGGIPELVSSETGFLLSEYPSPEEIAEKIISILSDKEKYQLLKQNCYKLFKEQFDSKNVSNKYAIELKMMIE